MRTCGDCTACCTVGAVPEIGKPPRTPCRFLISEKGGCGLFNDPMRPKVCHGFLCEWMRGAGSERDRPNKSGVMISVNEMNGGRWVFVVELWKNAYRTTGANVILDVASHADFPVVIVDYESPPPHDYGDYTVIKESLKDRARNMMGRSLGFLDKEHQFGIYELRMGVR